MSSVSAESQPKMKFPFSKEKVTPSIFWLLAVIALPIFNITVKFTYHGRPLPQQGAFILSPNHFSEIDPLVIGVATFKMGRLPRYMAKASLFRVPVLGWLLRASGQIPVERSGARAQVAMNSASDLVEKGRLVVVYPEGTLTRDPNLWPMRGKTGAVRLAIEHNIPLIPIAHWGTQDIMGRYSKKISLIPRKHVHIMVGEPMNMAKYRGKLDHTTLAKATDELMAEIAKLLGELRNETPPAVRWDPAKHAQSETGRFEQESSDG